MTERDAMLPLSESSANIVHTLELSKAITVLCGYGKILHFDDHCGSFST
jgi:hypothetical protein